VEHYEAGLREDFRAYLYVPHLFSKADFLFRQIVKMADLNSRLAGLFQNQRPANLILPKR